MQRQHVPHLSHHSMVYEACLELYQVHGMLSDVAEVLGIKTREQRASLEGKEREMPVLGLTGAVYLLQLFLLSYHSTSSDAIIGEKPSSAAGRACLRCQESKRRFSLWAVQHASATCQTALEAERADYRHFNASALDTEEAAHTRAISLKTLLIILMDLYETCPKAFPSSSSSTNDDGDDDENADEQQEEGEDARASCSRCEQIRHAAEIKAQNLEAAASSSSSFNKSSSSLLLSKRARSRGMKANKAKDSPDDLLSLPDAFLASVDGKFRTLIEERLDESRAYDNEAILEVRAAIMDLVRVVVRLCPIDSVEAEEIFAFIEPSSSSSSLSAKQKDSNDSMSMCKQNQLNLCYKGLPAFVYDLMMELSQALMTEGVPLRLVQSYLDLFESLLARLPPPQDHPSQLHVYYTWRTKLSEKIISMLVRTCISQASIIRRFVRLAMQIAPPAQAVTLAGGILQGTLRYFDTWLGEQQSGGGEVVTAAMARDQLEEEGDDELFPDGYDDEEDDDEDDVLGEENKSKSKRKQSAATGGKALDNILDASSMTFASVHCWRAALTVILSQWEQLVILSPQNDDNLVSSPLKTASIEGECAIGLDASSYASMMSHIESFFKAIDVGGHHVIKKKHRVAASFLPSPVKLRLLSLVAKIFSICRSAVGKASSHLRALAKAEAAATATTITQDGGKKKKKSSSAAVVHPEISRQQSTLLPNPCRSHEINMLLAYLQSGYSLARLVITWVETERTKPKQENPVYSCRV